MFLATGNDLGGSLRTPAGFNGVVGLRPSPGLIPRGDRYMPFDTLWVEGPMARTVEDIALMLDSMVGHDIGDPLSFKSKKGCFIESLKKDLNPISIAVSEDLNLVPVDSEVRKVFKTATNKLSKFGLDINDDIPDFSGVLNAFKTLRGVLMASMLGDLVKNHKYSILEASKQELDLLAKKLISESDTIIVISSYADCRGGNQYNINLSKNRSNAVRNYLISKGVSSKQIQTKSLGATNFVNNCYQADLCSEKEHSLNRRSEFQFISTNK